MDRILRMIASILITSMPLCAHGIEVFEPIVNMLRVLTYLAPILVAISIGLLLFFLLKKPAKIKPIKSVPNLKIMSAWQQAAKELQFEFEPKFRFQLDGVEFTFLGFIKDFGARKGTFLGPIMERDINIPTIGERLKNLGFFYSELSDSYGIFSDNLFKTTLDDLGYFGPDNKKPAWYKGKLQSS